MHNPHLIVPQLGGLFEIMNHGNNGIFAFASERKALWEVGINETHSLPPKYMLHNQELVELPGRLSWKNNHSISRSEIVTPPPKKHLQETLKNHIQESVQKRTLGLDKVGILFSGGLDSTLLAVICADLGIETDLYAVGSEGSPDLLFAHNVSRDIGLPLHTRIVDEQVVREYSPPVLNAIEEWNVMKLGVGMTAYLAAEMAHQQGQRVILSGQGADELFAGYHRYLDFYQEKGEKAQEDLQEDVENLYHVNLERDDKVTMAHSVELRVPYLDLQIINMALDIPMYYKINGPEDNRRKCILREVARELGVPPEIVNRPKKAAQYGSGIHKILRKKVLKDQVYMDNLKKTFKFIDI